MVSELEVPATTEELPPLLDDEEVSTDASCVEQRALETCHSACEEKAALIGTGQMADPGYKWHASVYKFGHVYQIPVDEAEAICQGAGDLSFKKLRAEFKEDGPRGGKYGQLAGQYELMKNFDKDVRTVPRFRHEMLNGVKTVPMGVRKLQAADTAAKLDELIRERMREIATATVEGTQTNTDSHFSNYKHFALESGKEPIRWRADDPNPLLKAQEWTFFKRFLVWGSVRWEKFSYLENVWSSVKSVHRRLANVNIPEYPSEEKFLDDIKLLMSRTTPVRKKRDLLTNVEMNTYQDEARDTVNECLRAMSARSRVSMKRLDNAQEEANFDFVTSMQRKHGLRPGETAKKHKDFVKLLKAHKERLATGHEGEEQQVPWTKAHVIALGSIKTGTCGWLTPPPQKSSSARDTWTAELLEMQLPFINVEGEYGLYTAVQAAQRLMLIDPLKPGEDPWEIPCVRHPRTGNSWESSSYSTFLQAHHERTKKPDDKRAITGYGVKHSSSCDFKKAASDAKCPDGDLLLRRYLSHTGGGVTERYSRDCRVETLCMAQRAHLAQATPVPHGHGGPSAMAVEELPKLSATEEAMYRGWDTASKQEVLAGIEMADSQHESDEMVAKFTDALEANRDLDAMLKQQLHTQTLELQPATTAAGNPGQQPQPPPSAAASIEDAVPTDGVDKPSTAPPDASGAKSSGAKPCKKQRATPSQPKPTAKKQAQAAPATATEAGQATSNSVMVYPGQHGTWDECTVTERGNFKKKLITSLEDPYMQEGVKDALSASKQGDGACLWTEVLTSDSVTRQMPRGLVITAARAGVGQTLPASLSAPLVFVGVDKVWTEGFPIGKEYRGRGVGKSLFITMLAASGVATTVHASRVLTFDNDRMPGTKSDDTVMSAAAAAKKWTRRSPRTVARPEDLGGAEADTVRPAGKSVAATLRGEHKESAAVPKVTQRHVPKAHRWQLEASSVEASQVSVYKTKMKTVLREYVEPTTGAVKPTSKLKLPEPTRLSTVLRRFGLTALAKVLVFSEFDTDVLINDASAEAVAEVLAEARLPMQLQNDAFELACVLRGAVRPEADDIMDGPVLVGEGGAMYGVWALTLGPIPARTPWRLKEQCELWRAAVFAGSCPAPELGDVARMEQAVGTIKQVADFLECGLCIRERSDSFNVGEIRGIPILAFVVLTALASKEIALDGVIWWHDETDYLIDDPVTRAALLALNELLQKWRSNGALSDGFWKAASTRDACFAYFVHRELQRKATGYTLQWITQVLLATQSKGWNDTPRKPETQKLSSLTGVHMILNTALRACPWQWTASIKTGHDAYAAAATGGWSMLAMIDIWGQWQLEEREMSDPDGKWRERQPDTGGATQYEPFWRVRWEEEDHDEQQVLKAAERACAADSPTQIIVREDNTEEWSIFMGTNLDKPAQPVCDSPADSDYGGTGGWGHSAGGAADDIRSAGGGPRDWRDAVEPQAKWGPPTRTKDEIAAGYARVAAHRLKKKQDAKQGLQADAERKREREQPQSPEMERSVADSPKPLGSVADSAGGASVAADAGRAASAGGAAGAGVTAGTDADVERKREREQPQSPEMERSAADSPKPLGSVADSAGGASVAADAGRAASAGGAAGAGVAASTDEVVQAGEGVPDSPAPKRHKLAGADGFGSWKDDEASEEEDEDEHDSSDESDGDVHARELEINDVVSMLFQLEGDSHATRFQGVVTGVETDDEMVTVEWSDGQETTFNPSVSIGFQIETANDIEGLVDDSIVMSQSPVSAAEYEKQNELETREQDLEKLPAQRRNRGQWNTKRYEPEQLVHDDVDDDDDGLGEDDPPQGRGPSQPAISGFFGTVTAVSASVGLSPGEDSRTSSNADGQPAADVVGSGADDEDGERRVMT